MRRTLVAIVCLAAVTVPVLAADRYPARPVRFVVPYAPGGGSDITARAIGGRLQEWLGQSFLIDNRPGAGSMVGTEIVARAPADGYTLILADMPHSINSVAHAKPRYDALRDFSPISLVGTAPILIAAHPSFPVNTLKDLLAMPKAQTEKFPVGSPGVGSAPHMTYELLRFRAGLSLTHVPYKGGGPLIADVIAGQIPLGMSATPTTLPPVRDGRVKALAITSSKRHPLLPNVPTVIESGVPNFEVIHWYGILGPAGMPKDVVDLLSRTIRKGLDTPEVRDRFTQLAIDVAGSTPEEFRRMLEADVARWRDVVRQAGIKLDF